MAKKVVSVFILALVTAGSVFAQGFSLGAGGYFTSDLGGGIEASAGGPTMSVKMPYYGGGGFVFVDETYAELSLGFFTAGGSIKQEFNGDSDSSKVSYTGLDVSLLGKYPFAVGGSLTVAPLAGIAYRVMISQKDKDGNKTDDAKDFSALWFKFGGGLDYSLTGSIYLRGEVLYGIRLVNNNEKDAKKIYSDQGADAKTLLGHGPEVKLAIGYKF